MCPKRFGCVLKDLDILKPGCCVQSFVFKLWNKAKQTELSERQNALSNVYVIRLWEIEGGEMYSVDGKRKHDRMYYKESIVLLSLSIKKRFIF